MVCFRYIIVNSLHEGDKDDDDDDDDNNNRYRTTDIGTINSNDRTPATLYSLGTLFVSGIYVKKNLHKGDSDDDDDDDDDNNNNNNVIIGLFMSARSISRCSHSRFGVA